MPKILKDGILFDLPEEPQAEPTLEDIARDWARSIVEVQETRKALYIELTDPMIAKEISNKGNILSCDFAPVKTVKDAIKSNNPYPSVPQELTYSAWEGLKSFMTPWKVDRVNEIKELVYSVFSEFETLDANKVV